MARKPKRDIIADFTAWVVAAGAERLAPTNPYELLRFRSDRGVGVIYRNEAGKQTWTGAALELRPLFDRGESVRLMPHAFVRRHRDKRYDTLIARDGDECFYRCGARMTIDSATIEHLCSRTHGGPDHIANIVLSCEPCNSTAGHLSVAEKVRIRERNSEPAAPIMRPIEPMAFAMDAGGGP